MSTELPGYDAWKAREPDRELSEAERHLATPCPRESGCSICYPSLKRITVEQTVPGYAHTRYQGVCSLDVTVEDIRRRFYDEYFGGRDAWVSDDTYERDGERVRLWKAIAHTD